MLSIREEREFAAVPESVPAARRLLRASLQSWNRDALADGGALVVTELVTNAVLHAREPIRLVLEPRDAGGLRIEVHDGSPVMPLRPRADEGSTTGRGMGLVALLAEHWGAELEGEGKYVWVEISPETEAAAAPVANAPAPREATSDDVDDLESWTDLVELADFADLADLSEPADLNGHHERPEDARPSRSADATRRYVVHLGDVPTRLLLSAKAHVDAVIRELTLTAGGAASGVTGALPLHLSELIRTVTQDFSEARHAIKRQALAAQERGDERTVLTLTLPASAAAAGRRYLEALEEADRYARGARLLTLASPPQHTLFRRWYVSSLVSALERASEGAEERAASTFEAFLLQAVDVLAELQLASALSVRLHRATEALASSLGPAQVAKTALEHAVSELGATSGSVLLSEGRVLEVLAARGLPGSPSRQQVASPTPGAHAHRTGQAAWVESREERDAQFPVLADPDRGVVATCAVPLLVAGHSIGALELAFPEGRLFSSDERAFLVALGGVTAQTLERARLDESRSSVVQRLTRLQAVTRALAQVRDTESVLDVIVAHGLGLVGASLASVNLLDPGGSTLRLRRVEPKPPDGTLRWQTFSMSDPLPPAEALRTRAPIWVKNVQERNERWPELRQIPWTWDKSMAVLPLHVDDQVLGVLTLVFALGDVADPEPAWEFLTAFADAAAQALERARVVERVEDANRKLAFLADAADQLGDSLDIERTLANLVRLAVPELADWCVVHLLERGELRPLAVAHIDPTLRELAAQVQEKWPVRLSDESGAGAVVRTGVPEYIADIPRKRAGTARPPTMDPGHVAALDTLGLESKLIVPLVARGRTLGAMTFVTSTPERHYGEEDLAFTQDLARRVSVAVDNARLFAALDSATGARPYGMGTGAATSERLAMVLETMLEAFFRVDTQWRFTYMNRAAEQLFFRRREELLGRTLWEEFPQAVGGPLRERCEQAMRTGQQVSFETQYARVGPWVEIRVTPDPDGLSAFLQVIEERKAIEAERQRANERLQTVASASSRFAALLEPTQVLDALADLIVPSMAGFASIALRGGVSATMFRDTARRDDDVRVVHVRTADPAAQDRVLGLLRTLSLSTRDTYGAGAVVRDGQPQEIAEVTSEIRRSIVDGDPEAYAALTDLGIGSLYTVPLVSRGRTLGAVSVSGARTLDRSLVAEVASRAAVALDNALLYGAERRNGVELQRHLLPRVSPQVPGIQIATRYLPSVKGALAGGDFYEALETDDGLVLALGDVVGHGMRSAARMGQLRAIVAALALQRLDPSELLTCIAADVDTLLDLGLATLLICRYDLGTRRLAVASAGHPPPLVASPGTPPAYVELDPGPPLGAGTGTYPLTTVAVPSGSSVVLFSDGLVERRGESLTVGLERIRAALEGQHRAPEAVADVLLQVADLEQGGDDDVALLVLTHD